MKICLDSIPFHDCGAMNGAFGSAINNWAKFAITAYALGIQAIIEAMIYRLWGKFASISCALGIQAVSGVMS